MNVFQRITGILEIQSALGKFQAALNKFNKENGMLTLGQTLKSKTFWLNVLVGGYALYHQIEGTLPPQFTAIVAAGLPLANIILKVFFNKQIPLPPTE